MKIDTVVAVADAAERYIDFVFWEERARVENTDLHDQTQAVIRRDAKRAVRQATRTLKEAVRVYRAAKEQDKIGVDAG